MPTSSMPPPAPTCCGGGPTDRPTSMEKQMADGKTGWAPILPSAICNRGISPGAGHEARLPARQKLACEAPTGAADPVTALVRQVGLLRSRRADRAGFPQGRHTGELERATPGTPAIDRAGTCPLTER